MGIMDGLKAFVAAVLGGIGNIPGAVLGGLLIGAAERSSSATAAMSAYVDVSRCGGVRDPYFGFVIKARGVVGFRTFKKRCRKSDF